VQVVNRVEAPELKTVRVNGAGLAVWYWDGSEPALLFAHATGFHGRSWDHIIRRFSESAQNCDHMRGHGRSSKLPPPYRWRNFGSDLAGVSEHFKLRDAIGIGHSMGGHSTVCAAALPPETYSALLLVDPAIFSRELYGTAPPHASLTLFSGVETSGNRPNR
jgi:pimeloyl-ACP methyl ester carboxylesterase